ncbi:MAG: TetR/AcrR family transcriptional regulator [Acidiferrobacter sp.]
MAHPLPRVHNPELTRKRLLTTAYEEMCKNGFYATKIDDILAKTGLAKGALYHHFPTKNDLGYAIIDEILLTDLREHWITPLEKAERPLKTLIDMISQASTCEIDMEYGCPLSTFSQELCPKDAEFRTRLNRIYDLWRNTIANALRQARRCGEISAPLNAKDTAAFIVASIEGALNTTKTSGSSVALQSAAKGLLSYLKTLSR